MTFEFSFESRNGNCRQVQVEAELEQQRADLRSKRTAFEQERTHIMELHDESRNALARMAEKDARIEALLVSRTDAEVRENMKASELHQLQSHSRRIQHEIELLHQDLSSATAGCVLEDVRHGAMHSQAGGDSAQELMRLRNQVHKVAQSARLADARAYELQERLKKTEKELSAAKAAEVAAKAEVETLRESVQSAHALLRHSEGSLEKLHANADDYRVALKHANTELRALEDSLAAAKAARDEAIATACTVTMRESPRAVSCADMQHVKWSVSQTETQACGACDGAEGAALAPESSDGAACRLSVGSSAARISQRLELLEMEEAELQDQYVTFRRSLAQQQYALQQYLATGVPPAQLSLSNFLPYATMPIEHVAGCHARVGIAQER
jgi:chromosome segregation ATPase